MSGRSGESWAGRPELKKKTARRRLANRLRYTHKPGALRLSRSLDARDWQHVVMALTGTEWGGDYGPPFAKTERYPWQGNEDRIFANNNDGMELWFGYPDRWTWHISDAEMKRLTRYLIVDVYLKSRWLGLRRRIYYAALSSYVDGLKRSRPIPPAAPEVEP